MRFDDSLETVLAADMATPFGAQSAWRQLTDLIGRRRAAPLPEAIARLRAIRATVPVAVRAASARSVAFGDPPAGLVRLFADDQPAIAAPVLHTARLSDGEWLAMLADLPTASRALLRERRDLSPDVARALSAFGSADFALPVPAGDLSADPVSHDHGTPIADAPAMPSGGERGPFAPVEAVEPMPPSVPADEPAGSLPKGPFRIADLVARIDAYQRDRAPGRPARPIAAHGAPLASFRFETDADGVIRWVEGAPREPLIGLALGKAAIRVDAIVTGAFRRRQAFDSARMVVAGHSAVAGDWQVSAAPAFDQATGRFTGLRGVARRPRADERAEPRGAATIPPDALRQLVHELRTPTNAISGFAEMIEAQVLGPAPEEYRARAGTIRHDVRDLLTVIDDVDTAARIEQHALPLTPERVAAFRLLDQVVADLTPLSAECGSSLDIHMLEPDLAVVGDAAAVRRVTARLFAAMVAVTGPGERIAVDATRDGAMACIAIDRPSAFAGLSAEALLTLDSDEGSALHGVLLGIGFTLRLVRNLAAELGGSLTIDDRRLTLRLPLALDRTVEQQSSN